MKGAIVSVLLGLVLANLVSAGTVNRHVKRSEGSVLDEVKHHIDEALLLTKDAKDTKKAFDEKLADKLDDELRSLDLWVHDIGQPEQKDVTDSNDAEVAEIETSHVEKDDLYTSKDGAVLETLEDSLEKAIAEDDKKEAKKEVQEKQVISNKQKLINFVNKDTENPTPVKRKIKSFTANEMFKDEFLDFESNEVNSPEVKVKDEFGVHLDRPQYIAAMDQKKKDVEELKNMVNDIKQDFGKIKNNFHAMKDMYVKAVKDGKTQDIKTKGKFDEVGNDMRGILGSLKALKDMIPKEDEQKSVKKEVDDGEELEHVRDFVGVIKDEIESTGTAVQDVMEMITTSKDEEEDEEARDMMELDSLKDEMKGIINNIKLKLKDAKMTSAVRNEVADMREDYENIKEKVNAILKRRV